MEKAVDNDPSSMKKRKQSVTPQAMVGAQHVIPINSAIFSIKRTSSLCAFASSILIIYICGIGFYLWSSNFSCRLRNLGDSTPVSISSLAFDAEQRGRYIIVKNYIRSAIYPVNTITLASAALFTDLSHLPEICGRWKGPMSISVYAPGSDFKAALKKIFSLRLANTCIHQNVTWHLFFDIEFSPSLDKFKSPEEEAGMTTAGSSSYDAWMKGTFKSHGHLPFPANIGRNVAIRESKTDFVLVSDLHYYPSIHIIPRFLQLLKYQGPTGNRVYVLPVFKMAGYGKPPDTKSELVQMTVEGNIVLPSGTSDCTQCNIFPNARKWLEVRSPDETLSVYYVSREKEEFESWQPYYISTRDIPPFDEDQIKEGKFDRKLQKIKTHVITAVFESINNRFPIRTLSAALRIPHSGQCIPSASATSDRNDPRREHPPELHPSQQPSEGKEDRRPPLPIRIGYGMFHVKLAQHTHV
ncbi:beta-1,4-glucuronyltransferase 1 [Trichonephila inaurata madagascariensis]|uniref:Beta-1,4-glucuronyltransferase 1 n=1 Tax=Trichonephila inaurata madagascariensis TaxID=2747483 RepID=A0A8X6XFR4_9ARAC|nr:beta-1,4-glucuronyltransferase 1 [Trichonephila inaurata madagascariensis]